MPSKPNPFQQLAENSQNSAHQDDRVVEDSTVAARKCPRCGAPRPARTDISHCAYCGERYMVVPVHVPARAGG
ncbi:MAG: hypothetical protein LBG66_02640 [Gallionellaceae bacterium]|jgi:uncharacterized Zn finger protein (UPF0148 family)|nr:hypothetical protein [Gallionellaceae bacterium]